MPPEISREIQISLAEGRRHTSNFFRDFTQVLDSASHFYTQLYGAPKLRRPLRELVSRRRF